MLYDPIFFNPRGCRPKKIVVLKEDLTQQIKFLLTIPELKDLSITQGLEHKTVASGIIWGTKYTSDVLCVHLTW